MKHLNTQPSKGFTLIELITVIVVLGVLASGMSQFLAFGSRIFAETSARDELISSARFSIERLNRELRHASPNSVEIVQLPGSTCLTFIPILGSTTYLDLPVAPEPSASSVIIAPFNQDRFAGAVSAIVYPLSVADYDVLNDKNQVFDSVDNTTSPHWELNFAPAVLFDADSPTQRIFFYGDSTSFCIEGSEFYRYSGGVNKTLMGEHLINYVDAQGNAYADPNDEIEAFSAIDSTQLRNSTVQIQLVYELNAEIISFNNEVQIPNVP